MYISIITLIRGKINSDSKWIKLRKNFLVQTIVRYMATEDVKNNEAAGFTY